MNDGRTFLAVMGVRAAAVVIAGLAVAVVAGLAVRLAVAAAGF